jgi:Ca-activated chloride channel family protein
MALWLLAVPAIAVFWGAQYLYKRHTRRRQLVQPRFTRLSRRTPFRRDVAILAFASLAVVFLVGALARPQLLVEQNAPEFQRHDLVVVLDRSVSMRARDVKPSRAERARSELKNFLRKKPDVIDRIGLVGFAGSPLILSYLSRDVDSMLFYLDWMAEDPSIFYGTDIGAALSSALEVVDREKSASRSVFVVISDGEDQGSTLASAIATIRRRNIPVHTIGIGSPQEALLPVSRPGEREVFLRDDEGRLVTTRYDETSLKFIADATGGRYARSQAGGELLTALDAIVLAERRQTGSRTVHEYRDVHRLLLAGALVAVAALVASV